MHNQSESSNNKKNSKISDLQMFGCTSICVSATYLSLFFFLRKTIGLQPNDALKKAVGASLIAVGSTFGLFLIVGLALSLASNKQNSEQQNKSNGIKLSACIAICSSVTYLGLFAFLHKSIGLQPNDALKKAVAATVVSLATTFGLFVVSFAISEGISACINGAQAEQVGTASGRSRS